MFLRGHRVELWGLCYHPLPEPADVSRHRAHGTLGAQPAHVSAPAGNPCALLFREGAASSFKPRAGTGALSSAAQLKGPASHFQDSQVSIQGLRTPAP